MHRHLRHIFVATVLVAVWVTTPLLSVVHIVIDDHTYCAEHGALEEGTGHTAAHDASKGKDKQLGPSSVRADTRDGPEQDPHTACAFDDVFTREIVPFDVSVVAVTAPTAQPTSAPVTRHVVQEASRLLLAAPKTSPPVTA